MPVKGGLTDATKKGKDVRDETLRKSLDVVAADLSVKFPGTGDAHILPSDLKQKVVHTCELCVFVCRRKWFTPDKMMEGFVRCGQHMKAPGPQGETVSFRKIMGQSLASVEPLELEYMERILPRCVEELRKEGKLTNAFLDEMGVCKTQGAEDLDGNELSKEDACNFTNDHIVNGQMEYRRIRAEAKLASAAAKAEKERQQTPEAQQLAAAQKLLDAVQKKNDEAAAKAALKANEANRRAGLTLPERKAEDDAKKAAAAAKKSTKVTADAAATAAATALVAGAAVPVPASVPGAGAQAAVAPVHAATGAGAGVAAGAGEEAVHSKDRGMVQESVSWTHAALRCYELVASSFAHHLHPRLQHHGVDVEALTKDPD
ncbi:hypothetical protein B484DRAFT_469266 [Ochromonadaceae sp. CCMP2298]|nr:hypothetical protein B484DRAFT_469266 [Ochromonadaceae sp. CCMP2298]